LNPRLKTHAGVMVSQSERRSGAFALLEAYRRATVNVEAYALRDAYALLEAYRRANVEACAFLRAFALLDAR
jgi:aminoglycoside phosphotransferase family enzyme